jgi:hypothetical protein
MYLSDVVQPPWFPRAAKTTTGSFFGANPYTGTRCVCLSVCSACPSLSEFYPYPERDRYIVTPGLPRPWSVPYDRGEKEELQKAFFQRGD